MAVLVGFASWGAASQLLSFIAVSVSLTLFLLKPRLINLGCCVSDPEKYLSTLLPSTGEVPRTEVGSSVRCLVFVSMVRLLSRDLQVLL